MDNQVIQFLQENKEQIKNHVVKIMPFLEKEMEKNGFSGVVQYAYGFIDKTHEKLDMAGKTTCSAGCSFCCYSDINMSFSEANHILEVVNHFNVQIDKTLLKKQQSKKWHRLKYAEKRCVMLDKDGKCKIYDHRPIICRLWNSTSDPKDCDVKGAAYAVTRTARVVECWAMSLALLQIDMTNKISTKDIFLHKILE